MACRYPDARSPVELWENALAQRKSFRRIPAGRFSVSDYWSDRETPDTTYITEAALIEDYQFDRLRFKVAGNTYRSTDLTHWLALDIASQALADADYPDGSGLPRDTTGVIVGNTLTGELSRAHLLRLRWPYVSRLVESGLVEQDWPAARRQTFLKRLEKSFKEPFPPPNEETLAGSLANTIAGRISNHFNLKGGGYTVDGACASSLLAVATACSSLVSHDLDVALAGGVDISLDPFELVGFARTQALARGDMKVYDAGSTGFLPGEGCGFIILMRYEDALAAGKRVLAVIRGWGISSDGSGGITRPEVKGQMLALDRAYKRAGFGIETIAYFEGHGTGTMVGDTTELRAVCRARRARSAATPAAAIGSIKANIGHTKAAAGIAGLIKATMAVRERVIPPTTGCDEPNLELKSSHDQLRAPRQPEPWPADSVPRAGVSAMGFGGINTHVVLEAEPGTRTASVNDEKTSLPQGYQDAELFLLSASDLGNLRQQVEHLLTFAASLSQAELTDLAVHLKGALRGFQVRAAVVAATAAEFRAGLRHLLLALTDEKSAHIDPKLGVFFGTTGSAPRIGFLFPGQASATHLTGGIMRRRFNRVAELYERASFSAGDDATETAVAQPAIVTASMAGLRMLHRLGINAELGIGHSLGEITALFWAGSLTEESLLRIVNMRGEVMSCQGLPNGSMAAIGASCHVVEPLLDDDRIVIAALNSPTQTVISGEAVAVRRLSDRLRAQGIAANGLPVSRAFHSPMMAAAAVVFADRLSAEEFHSLKRTVVSTVTGKRLRREQSLPMLLRDQMTSPVRFMTAASNAVQSVDLMIEVGPGRTLCGLVEEITGLPAIPLDAGGESLKGLLKAVGAAFAMGTEVDYEFLFAHRFARPFSLDRRPSFFLNPCETAPLTEELATEEDATPQEEGPSAEAAADCQTASGAESSMHLIRRLVAERTELPIDQVRHDAQFLGDLHLNSISVSQIIAQAAKLSGLPPPISPTDYSTVTLGDAARALDEMKQTIGALELHDDKVAGVESWIRTFTVQLVERPLRPVEHHTGRGRWHVFAPNNHLLAERLRKALDERVEGEGVLVCLPPNPDERHVGLLLQGAKAALDGERASRFVLLQHGGGAAAFARTLCLEAADISVRVIDAPANHSSIVDWVVAEASAPARYVEAHYDWLGRRREPVLRLLEPADDSERLQLGPEDVLLVTGGGKGIAAECALQLAKLTGLKLVLLGKSDPMDDIELASNLNRMAAANILYRYIPADVTDEQAVKIAIAQAEADFGSITALLHGAGRNEPKSLRYLDEQSFLRTLAPKLQGARNVLATINPDKLRLFITFGSLIARTGLAGEGDYGVANEWLTRLTELWQAEHPACRCLALEWSIWSGVGMGERLGRVDALSLQGITPIPPDEGVRLFNHLIGRDTGDVAIIVAGRTGELPTLTLEKPDLPFLRFMEMPRAYVPGVELITDAELSLSTDPYLEDHVIEGQPIFPAVLGLEAMAQVGSALAESRRPTGFENVRFDRPITVPADAPCLIRIAALVKGPGRISVVIRSSETRFQVDHFSATCCFEPTVLADVRVQGAGSEFGREKQQISTDGLYGDILFHSGRFRRLRAYRRLKPRECIAEVDNYEELDWFSRYLSQELALGDPAARDAAIHAIQACIPHTTILPVGVGRISLLETVAVGLRIVYARERSCEGNSFTYDVIVADQSGRVLEHWEGLKLGVAGRKKLDVGRSAYLLGIYLERRLSELLPGTDVAIRVMQDASMDRRARADALICTSLGEPVTVWRRADGRPEAASAAQLSVAHAGPLTLTVLGEGPVGCDIEPVTCKSSSVWRNLLRADRYDLAQTVSGEMNEDFDTAATRVWTANECLKKAGAAVDSPLLLRSTTADNCVLFSSGKLTILTCLATAGAAKGLLAAAVLVKGCYEELITPQRHQLVSAQAERSGLT